MKAISKWLGRLEDTFCPAVETEHTRHREARLEAERRRVAEALALEGYSCGNLLRLLHGRIVAVEIIGPRIRALPRLIEVGRRQS